MRARATKAIQSFTSSGVPIFWAGTTRGLPIFYWIASRRLGARGL